MLPHKDWVLPEVDLSHDGGDPRWHAAQLGETGALGTTPVRDDQGNIRYYSWNGLEPGFWAGYWQMCIVDEWARIVADYEAHPDDAHAAWYYLDHHPVFWRFEKLGQEDYPANHVAHLEHEYAMSRGWPEITPHKVNPDTNRIEEDDALNTRIQWWYEFGPWSLTPGEPSIATHDYELDSGTETYEQAIIEIARKVHDNYGNDRRVVDSEEWRKGGGDGDSEQAQAE